MTGSIEVRRFDTPDQLLDMKERGGISIIKMADGTAAMHAIFEPGWTWEADDSTRQYARIAQRWVFRWQVTAPALADASRLDVALREPRALPARIDQRPSATRQSSPRVTRTANESS